MGILVVPCWEESYIRTHEEVVPSQILNSCYLLPSPTLPFHRAECLDVSIYIYKYLMRAVRLISHVVTKYLLTSMCQT